MSAAAAATTKLTGGGGVLKLEHIRFRRRQTALLPCFAGERDPETLRQCRELLDAFSAAAAARWTRGELEAWCASLARKEKDGRFSSGAAKLIFDRTDFSEGDVRMPELRRRLLSRSAEALELSGGNYRRYRALILGEQEKQDIYGDLPQFARLENCRGYSGCEELINAYNIALIQTLLLYTSRLRLEFAAPRPEELRPLLRKMRFHRLLATGTRLTPESTVVEIDGPFSILESSRKYALQLAMFFPAVLHMRRWKLQAEVEIPPRVLTLKLDDTSPLRARGRHSDYLPPEIAAFQNAFRSGEWELSHDAPAFIPDADAPVIPDFSFRRRRDGLIVHLELFHRWHRTGLTSRLASPEKLRRMHLLLGVDRSLSGALDSFPEAENAGLVFRFRDFPGVETTLRALKKSGF